MTTTSQRMASADAAWLHVDRPTNDTAYVQTVYDEVES